MFDPFLPVTELARLIRTRALSSTEVVTTYLNRIERLDPKVNAIVWRDADASLAAAQQADAALAAGAEVGPFHGVPIPIKDLTEAAGQPCFYGSLGTSDEPVTTSEPVVERLVAAGFVLMGRTAAPEAGTMTVTESRRFGVCRNPWDPSRSPGGSSGGAAAAVAAGLAPVAHASDGGGSIRVPASSCGLVGLKPSRGRVPVRVAGWEHAATDGAETRTVRDAAAVLDVIGTPDPLAMYNAPRPSRPFTAEVGAPPGRLRIGLALEPPTGVAVDDECLRAATATATVLADMGHTVEPVAPLSYSERAVTGYLTHIMDASVAQLPYADPALAEPYLQFRMERARRATAADYVTSALLLQLESRDVVAQFGRDFDLVLSPTMATLPVPAGVLVAEANADPEGPRLTEMRMVSFTSWVNLAGLPAVSLPLHVSAEGLPVGTQLVAGPWQDDLLIRVASSLEEAMPWRSRRPPAFAEPVSAPRVGSGTPGD
ncbi:amidase [Pseudonocardia sp. CA-107938]|uniref:amidase n=1 Tax=Pseudonocardia sp. CA-107938 TaxID=3240021 RepID=UPI003D8DEA24